MCIQTSLGQERSHGQKAMSHTNSENRPAENSLSSADRFCRSMRKGEEGDGPGRTLQLLRGICPLSWSSGWGADTWEAQRALHPVSGPQKSSAPGPRCLVNPEMKKSPASSPHHEPSSWWTGLPSLLFGEPILDYAAGPTFVNLHAAGQWQPCTVTGQREKSRRNTAPAGGPPVHASRCACAQSHATPGPWDSSRVASAVRDSGIAPNLEFSFQMLPTRYCSVRPCPVKWKHIYNHSCLNQWRFPSFPRPFKVRCRLLRFWFQVLIGFVSDASIA